MRRIQRNERALTDNSTPSGVSRERNNRRTTALNDMSNLGNIRRVQSPRRSTMMPPLLQLDITRRHEAEVNNNEMPLLYDKYLRTLMIEHIMKRKEMERQRVILIHLASLEKKGEECDMKLHEIQMRINEFQPLNDVQKYLEDQIQNIEKFLAANQSKVTDILDKIHLNLKSFDKLVCKNVIIPETIDQLMTMHKLLDECSELLDSISSFMGKKSVEMILTSDYLKKFQELVTITEKLLRETHNNLEHVQIDILKKSSATLSTNNM